MEQHFRPSPQKPEDYKKWNEQYLAATDEWLRRWPDAESLIREQRESVTLLHDLPTEEVLSIIDRYAEIAKLSPDAVVSFTPFPILAAEEYVKRQVRLDRVPKMIETGLHQAKLEQKYQLNPELTSRVGGLHHRYTWDAIA